MKLSVYTQNVFWIPMYGVKGRLRTIAAKILELSPDVVFLQEIQWKRHVHIFEHSDYQLFHAPGLYATAGGLLTLVKKELKGESKFVKYRSQGGVKQVADRLLGKGLLDVYIPKFDLHLLNTHFMSTYSKGFVADLSQLAQIQQFMDYTDELKTFIGAGDLNFPAGSEYHTKLMEKMVDFTLELDHSHVYSKTKLDFVIGKGKIKASKKEYVVYDKFVSDHKGILVEFEV